MLKTLKTVIQILLLFVPSLFRIAPAHVKTMLVMPGSPDVSWCSSIFLPILL